MNYQTTKKLFDIEVPYHSRAHEKDAFKLNRLVFREISEMSKKVLTIPARVDAKKQEPRKLSNAEF